MIVTSHGEQCLQPITIRKKLPQNRVPFSVVTEEWSVWLIFALPLLLLFLAILNGDPLNAAIALGAEVFALWYFTGQLLLYRTLKVLYLNRGNPNQFEIERVARQNLLTLKSLPVYKGQARVPLLSLMAYGEAMQGKYDEAEETYWEVAGSLVDKKQEKSLNYALHIYNLSLTAMKQGRADEALLLGEESLTVFQDHLPSELLGTVYPLNWLGWIWLNKGDLNKAQEYLERAWRILAMPFKLPWWLRSDHIDQLKLANRVNFSTVILKRDDLEGAEKMFDQIVSLLTESFNTMVPSSITEVVVLADQFRKSGDSKRAQILLDICYQYGRRIPNHPDCAEILSAYEVLLAEIGRVDEVGNMKTWLLETSADQEEPSDSNQAKP
ncbi:MAG: hypothetical protein K8F91_13135 [Candidatus Obscuribacterales bacterium]|nr:hypothetical protein [Candidatus Obscuribacterales bacterium]